MTNNRDDVAEVLDRVRRHEMTPREAERLWDEQGQEPPIATKSPGGLPRVVWPLSLAFAWIAWRSDAVLEREWERLRFWGVTLEGEAAAAGQVMTISDARRELADALLAGRIVASGIENNQSVRTPIETVEWPELKFEPGGSPNVLSKGWMQLRWHDVRVAEADVRKIWAIKTPIETTTVATSSRNTGARSTSNNRGGRPPDYDWDAMWIEVVRLAIEGEIKNRPELSRHLLAWFVQQIGKEPGETVLKTKMAKLFTTLGWE